MPKFYGKNKKRIDPRYFLEETAYSREDDPPWGPNDPEHNVRTLPGAEHPRATQLAHGAMAVQIRKLSDTELQAAWDKVDPYGTNPQGAEEQRKPLEKEMVYRFRKELEERTPEGGWSLDRDNDGVRDDKEQAIVDILDDKDEGAEWTKEEEDKIRNSVLGSMAKNPPSTPWSKGRQ
jgi:hypothetical protein